jgi:ATP-dependent Lhr-like helicase
MSFDRLSGAMQYHIVNTLGFAGLRPVQELSIDAVLNGKNCVILAPTAGGKTEAALFPLLSRMDSESWQPISVIYVAPLRALLNNQEDRLCRYAQMIGRRAFKWHGDVTDSSRRAFVSEPADILLTTPESLEVMMMSARVPARRLFANLRSVVIDEVHAFAGDDRGGHLSALLERLSRFCGQDVQRIGLSATIGNPETILEWAAGSSKRGGIVVRPPPATSSPELLIDYVASLQNAAQVIAGLHPGKKRLVFVDSRANVEAVGADLHRMGVRTFVTHSALAREERERAERAFENERECVIVATSALELGIDIGDLDHVLQIDCPSTVASFLQRMGRSGRRAGTRPNYLFLATSEESLVQCAALARLYRRGYVEPIELRQRCAHLLAHQLLALSIQENGIPFGDYWAWVAHATPFAKLTSEDRKELVDHMLAEGILRLDGGRLSLGTRGEQLYGFRHFMELYSVFSTPKLLTVLWGTQEIGTLEAQFVEAQELGGLTFTLGARSWRAMHVDWDSGVLDVEPAESRKVARWIGQPRLLGRELCESIRDVLAGAEVDAGWSKRAMDQMAKTRLEHGFLGAQGATWAREGRDLRVWTFAGGRANGLVAALLRELLGDTVSSNNLSIVFRDGAAQSEVAIRAALSALAAAQRPTRDDAMRLSTGLARTRLSKFQPCMTERLEAAYLADQLADEGSARDCVASLSRLS